MRTTIACTAIAASMSAALAAPSIPFADHLIASLKAVTEAPASETHNAVNGTQVIIMVDPNSDDSKLSFNDWVAQETAEHGFSVSDITYNLTNTNPQGFVATLGHHCKSSLINKPSIMVVEEDVEVHSFDQQQGSPWGLQSISNDAGVSGDPSNSGFTYSYSDSQLGAGVDVYVLDTGVRTSHAVFQGRAIEGWGYEGRVVDGDGHGTHCAGTVAGIKFGVAQGANIIGVKVLKDDGTGLSSDTVKGIDYAIGRHNKRKTEPGFKGSVLSLSWGLGQHVQAVDQAILGASNSGIHISAAAGNDAKDACQASPSHNGGANSNVVTVGSVNINNEVSSFSNFGSCVDIYAPGEQILSASNLGDTIVDFSTGTSMACPHVSGVMAYLISQDVEGLGQNPAALKQRLLETARKNVVAGNTHGTPNVLLSNGDDGHVAAKRFIRGLMAPTESRVPIDGDWTVSSYESRLRL